MKHLFLFLFSIMNLSVVAQSTIVEPKGRIQGAVYDEKTKETVPYASVRLLTQKDSTYVYGVATNEKGKFSLTATPDKYILEISFIGYKTFSKNIETTRQRPNFTVEDIFLQEDAHLLKETVVEATVPDIMVKGDTIEYNASAYTPEENAMLQDMIRNIPGMEIDGNGRITANGKPVEKILIDGKEFFGNDIAMALTNLPANMIKKLQLFKKQSETAEVTGFKDKNPDLVLNLVVKEELKQSTFGDIKGGYGSDDRYANRVLVNHMYNDNQYSLIGEMNNVSDNSSMRAGRDGVDRNKNIGMNVYTQSSEKIKVGANARYANNYNLLETETNTNTFLSSGDRISKQDLSVKNKRGGMNAGANVQWAPDSLTMIFIRTNFGLNNTDNNQTGTDKSFVAGGDTTSGYSAIKTSGDGYNISNILTIGRKLNKKGRNVSFTLNHSLRNDSNNGTNYSFTTFGGGIDDRIIDQKTSTTSKGNNYSISLSYVEPLGKDNFLQLEYTYNKSTSKRDREALRKDDAGNYTVIDTAFTRNTENNFTNQNISLNFQSRKEKYNYTVGFSLDPSRSFSRISVGDSILEDLRQQVVNFSPSLHFSYNPNPNKNLDFNYSGSTGQPGISQLSADTIVINALNKIYGNPQLKPSYNNNMNVYYQKLNYNTNRFFMLSGGFSYIFNNIVDYTKIDEQGNTVTTYRNVTGNMGANMNCMYNTPLKNKKFSINNTANTNYYKNIGFANGEKAITNNIVLSEQIAVKFKSKKVETSIEGGISHNISKNNLTELQNKNVTNYTFRHYILLKLPYDFSFQSNIDFAYFSGYQGNFKNSEILWNAGLAKQFMKNKKGLLRFQFFDILNDRNNISRIVNSNYVSDSRTNTVNQYFMLSFSYRFNIIKGGGKKDRGEES